MAKAPFRMFSVKVSEPGWGEFTVEALGNVELFPQSVAADREQRQFIEEAIREKLERTK